MDLVDIGGHCEISVKVVSIVDFPSMKMKYELMKVLMWCGSNLEMSKLDKSHRRNLAFSLDLRFLLGARIA